MSFSAMFDVADRQRTEERRQAEEQREREKERERERKRKQLMAVKSNVTKLRCLYPRAHSNLFFFFIIESWTGTKEVAARH